MAGLKVRPSTCNFLHKEITFIEHVVDAQEIHTSDKKVTAVANLPKPNSSDDGRSFLELSGYYRQFIQGYAQIVTPLTKSLKKNEPTVWIHTFETLKTALINALVEVYSGYKKPFLLCTKASSVGLGTLLIQVDHAKSKSVIAYANCAINAAERNYTVMSLIGKL